MNDELTDYIHSQILPRYDHFDPAHRRDHAEKVIRESLLLAERYDVDPDMVYAIAAYHDTGLCEGRENHHLASGRIVRTDPMLPRWFSPEQIETMAQVTEDHRASAQHEPRSLYGRSWPRPTATSSPKQSSAAPSSTDSPTTPPFPPKSTSSAP